MAEQAVLAPLELAMTQVGDTLLAVLRGSPQDLCLDPVPTLLSELGHLPLVRWPREPTLECRILAGLLRGSRLDRLPCDAPHEGAVRDLGSPRAFGGRQVSSGVDFGFEASPRLDPVAALRLLPVPGLVHVHSRHYCAIVDGLVGGARRRAIVLVILIAASGMSQVHSRGQVRHDWLVTPASLVPFGVIVLPRDLPTGYEASG